MMTMTTNPKSDQPTEVLQMLDQRLAELHEANDWIEKEIAKVTRQSASKTRDARKNQLLHELQEVIDDIEQLEASQKQQELEASNG